MGRPIVGDYRRVFIVGAEVQATAAELMDVDVVADAPCIGSCPVPPDSRRVDCGRHRATARDLFLPLGHCKTRNLLGYWPTLGLPGLKNSGGVPPPVIGR